MKDRQNDLDRGDLLFRVLVDGDTAAVVDDRDGIVFMDGHVDLRAVAGQSLVDRVVDDLVDQMMQTARTGGTDVHTGALADRFEALEHLDVRAIVMAGILLCHVPTPFQVRLMG